MAERRPVEEMSAEEIDREIERLEEDLEDLEAERSLTLGQTGVHIGAKEVERIRSEFEKDEQRIRRRLEELERA